MFSQSKSILVSPLRLRCAAALLALGGLAACGQKGDLYLPTGEAARGRATLPQVLMPGSTAAPAAPGPTSSTSPASPAGAASAPLRSTP